jgi:signal transduction histidine kinase
MDWGLAKTLASGQRQPPEAPEASTIDTVRTRAEGPTQHGRVMGTLAFMSPEQARGEVESLDERCDVFSLGAILCVLLTGQTPYPGEGRDEVRRLAEAGELAGAFARLEASGADAELVGLAKRCLAPRPEARPRDAGEVAQALADYRAGVQERLRSAELERALAQTRAQQEAAKVRFLAMLTHEVRGSLAHLRTGLHVLKAKGSTDPAVVQAQDMMGREVDHLGRLVDDLQDLARLTTGAAVLRSERLDLARLVRQAAGDWQRTPGQGGLSLEVQAPEIPAWVRGDEARLTRILSRIWSQVAQ